MNFKKNDPTKYAKYQGSEEDLQKTLARYLDLLGLVWVHPPNEIKAKPQYLKKRKALGVKAGVPDVLIFNPSGKYNGLAIELKVGYNKPSQAQLDWLDKLAGLGWLTLVAYSLDEAIEVIDNYIKP